MFGCATKKVVDFALIDVFAGRGTEEVLVTARQVGR